MLSASVTKMQPIKWEKKKKSNIFTSQETEETGLEYLWSKQSKEYGRHFR